MKFFYDSNGSRWNANHIVGIRVINLGERLICTMVEGTEVMPVHYGVDNSPWRVEPFCHAFEIGMIAS